MNEGEAADYAYLVVDLPDWIKQEGDEYHVNDVLRFLLGDGRLKNLHQNGCYVPWIHPVDDELLKKYMYFVDLERDQKNEHVRAKEKVENRAEIESLLRWFKLGGKSVGSDRVKIKQAAEQHFEKIDAVADRLGINLMSFPAHETNSSEHKKLKKRLRRELGIKSSKQYGAFTWSQFEDGWKWGKRKENNKINEI